MLGEEIFAAGRIDSSLGVVARFFKSEPKGTAEEEE